MKEENIVDTIKQCYPDIRMIIMSKIFLETIPELNTLDREQQLIQMIHQYINEENSDTMTSIINKLTPENVKHLYTYVLDVLSIEDIQRDDAQILNSGLVTIMSTELSTRMLSLWEETSPLAEGITNFLQLLHNEKKSALTDDNCQYIIFVRSLTNIFQSVVSSDHNIYQIMGKMLPTN